VLRSRRGRAAGLGQLGVAEPSGVFKQASPFSAGLTASYPQAREGVVNTVSGSFNGRIPSKKGLPREGLVQKIKQ